MLLRGTKTNFPAKKFSFFLLVFLFISGISNAQTNLYSIGIDAGYSSMQSLSIPVTAGHFELNFEFPSRLSDDLDFQLSCFYVRDMNYYIPDNLTNQNYPYYLGLTFQGVLRQNIKSKLFAEEEAGVLLLNNRFFFNQNETNYGIRFGISVGLDLTGESSNGFFIGIGYKVGITFNGSSPSFNSLTLKSQYVFEL